MALPSNWDQSWIVGKTPEGYDIVQPRDASGQKIQGTFVSGPQGTVEYAQYQKYGFNPVPTDAIRQGDNFYTQDQFKQNSQNAYSQLTGGAWQGGESVMDSDKMRAAGWTFGPGGWEKNGTSLNDAYAQMTKPQDTSTQPWSQQQAQQQTAPQGPIGWNGGSMVGNVGLQPMYGQQSAPSNSLLTNPQGSNFLGGQSIRPPSPELPMAADYSVFTNPGSTDNPLKGLQPMYGQATQQSAQQPQLMPPTMPLQTPAGGQAVPFGGGLLSGGSGANPYQGLTQSQGALNAAPMANFFSRYWGKG